MFLLVLWAMSYSQGLKIWGKYKSILRALLRAIYESGRYQYNVTWKCLKEAPKVLSEFWGLKKVFEGVREEL